MAKQAPKQASNHKGRLLKFIGSVAYVVVVFSLWTNPPAWLAGGLWTSLPALALGIIAATAVLSSIAYFFATLGGTMMAKNDDENMRMMNMWTWKTGMWASFSLFVLTLPGPWSWVVLIGFVLSLIGSAATMM